MVRSRSGDDRRVIDIERGEQRPVFERFEDGFAAAEASQGLVTRSELTAGGLGCRADVLTKKGAKHGGRASNRQMEFEENVAGTEVQGGSARQMVFGTLPKERGSSLLLTGGESVVPSITPARKTGEKVPSFASFCNAREYGSYPIPL